MAEGVKSTDKGHRAHDALCVGRDGFVEAEEQVREFGLCGVDEFESRRFSASRSSSNH